MESAKNLIFKACLALDRCGVVTYSNTEISSLDRESGVLIIKPHGMDGSESDIMSVSLKDIGDNIPNRESARLHAELYSRFPEISSIAHTGSEWISICSAAGWSLENSSYGYIPRFECKVPCTEKIAVGKTDADYARLAADAVKAAVSGANLASPRAVLLRENGALLFSESPISVAEDAITLEYAAKKAFYIRKFR